jgi:hypothetical protein
MNNEAANWQAGKPATCRTPEHGTKATKEPKSRKQIHAFCLHVEVFRLCGHFVVEVGRLNSTMASLNVAGSSLRYKNLLVVIKQTAFEEYSQVSCEALSESSKFCHKRYKKIFISCEKVSDFLVSMLSQLSKAETSWTSSEGSPMETSRATL